MARILLEPENTNNPETKIVFDEIKAAVGKVPAAYRAFGRSAHIVAANWNRTKNILGKGNLPRDLKEAIALAVSTANGCHFCVSIHRENLAKHGYSEEQIAKVEKGESEDQKINVVLKFTVQATRDPHKLSNDDFAKLQSFGYSEEDILEMLTVMEMYTGYNKIIVALGIQLED